MIIGVAKLNIWGLRCKCNLKRSKVLPVLGSDRYDFIRGLTQLILGSAGSFVLSSFWFATALVRGSARMGLRKKC